ETLTERSIRADLRFASVTTIRDILDHCLLALCLPSARELVKDFMENLDEETVAKMENATMVPGSLSLHCLYSLIRPSLRLPLPPWCVVSAWENAGLSGCYELRRRPQGPSGVLLEPSVPAMGLQVAYAHNE
ncbi:hypothetical protein GOODEAATRI_016501, partial [Goodea atripinnis]